MIDLHKETEGNDERLKALYVKTIEAFCGLRLRSEVDERSFDLVMQCLEECILIMEEHMAVIDDELLDTVFWEIDQEAKSGAKD